MIELSGGLDGEVKERPILSNGARALEKSQYPLVSIVMPAFNEDKTIVSVVSEIIVEMKKHGLSFEIIVVDDGSKDKTFCKASLCPVTVLANDKNRGKGYCLRRGLKSARGEIIVTMDSDGEHKPTDIIRLLKPIFNGMDIVAGSRFLNGNLSFTSRSHLIGNHLFNFAVRALTGRYITDSQTGFRAIRRRVLESFPLESDGFEIETELTVKSLRNGFEFTEVPISIRRREYGVTRIKLVADGTKILKTIVKSGLAVI